MENQSDSAEELNPNEENETVQEIPTHCLNCNFELDENPDTYCPNCGFPVMGTEKEVQNFFRKIELTHQVLKDAEKKVNRVRIMLLILAGINIIAGLVISMAGDNLFEDASILGISSIIMGIIFIACASWVRRDPVAGIITAFSLYVLVQLASAIMDPTTLVSGIIFKIIIIAIFISGVRSAFDYREYKRKLDERSV